MATGEIETYTANQLAEYLYDQVDDYGRSSTLFEGKAKGQRKCSKYYAYLAIYVDDILCIDIEPGKTISSIGELFRIKKVVLLAHQCIWAPMSENGAIRHAMGLPGNDMPWGPIVM